MRLSIIASLVWFASLAFAAPTNTTEAPEYTLLADDVFDSWKEYARYAGAVYCPRYIVKPWLCHHCRAIKPAPKLIELGGLNLLTPRWLVANNGTHTILSISGTNSIAMWVLDLAALILKPVPKEHFPGAPDMQMHPGWYHAFTLMKGKIEAAVKRSRATAPKLLIVGHSLGAAEGLIFTTYFKANYPDWDVSGRLFALPRVGDKAWADYVDKINGDSQQHLTHFNDPIAALPLREFGWHHPSGELWIDSIKGDQVRVLPGQENPNGQASMSLGELVKQGVINLNLFPQSHLGPYNGINISPFLCPPPTIIKREED